MSDVEQDYLMPRTCRIGKEEIAIEKVLFTASVLIDLSQQGRSPDPDKIQHRAQLCGDVELRAKEAGREMTIEPSEMRPLLSFLQEVIGY